MPHTPSPAHRRRSVASPRYKFGTMDDKLWVLETLFKTQKQQGVDVPELRSHDLQLLAESLETLQYSQGDLVVMAGDFDETRARLYLFRSGGAEVVAAVLGTHEETTPQGRRRKSVTKTKRVCRLKSPFYVGEGWILTGQTPKCSVIATGVGEAYALRRDDVERLTSGGNTSVNLIKRDLRICAFERRHLHGFVNTLYQNNMDDGELMRAFDSYGAEAYCTESFDFCKAAHLFRKRYADEGPETFPDANKEFATLAALYWEPREIEPGCFAKGGVLNLSARQKKKIDAGRVEAENDKSCAKLCALLDAPVNTVYREIQQSQLVPFMKSHHYEGYLAKSYPIPGVRRSVILKHHSDAKAGSGACAIS